MIEIIKGDCLQSLKKLEDQSINTCVTSPPYWGLRNYNDEEKQLGMEDTIEKFVENLVKVFREVKRVLREDGTVWLNLGDTYLQNKQLVGIPWRVALALQQDGWYLRQDIIWHKPNPMPEAVKDRCVKSHEYIFLFSLKPRYYFDYKAIQEPAAYAGDNRSLRNDARRDEPMANAIAANTQPTQEFRNKRSIWTINTAQSGEAHFAVFPEKIPELCIKAGTKEGDVVLDPFMGSGTTASVAQRLGRKWIGIELNEEYAQIINKKTAQGELF